MANQIDNIEDRKVNVFPFIFLLVFIGVIVFVVLKVIPYIKEANATGGAAVTEDRQEESEESETYSETETDKASNDVQREEIIAQNVTESADTKSVQEPTIKEEEKRYKYLSELTPYKQNDNDPDFIIYDSVTDNFGTSYKNGIGGTDGWGQSSQEYILNGKYSEMRGRVALNYDVRTQDSDDVYLWVYGDNIALFMSQVIKAGCEPQDFIVDLTGVSTLKVVIQGESMLRLVDCCLYEDASVPTVSTAIKRREPTQDIVYLKDIDWFNASEEYGGFNYYDSVKDNFGTTYANGIGGSDGWNESYQEYDLNGGFSEMRGQVVLNYEVRTQNSDDVYLWIYGDDNLLFQSQVITAGCEPQGFNVDLNGVSKMKVVIQGKSMLRLVDCCLYKDSSLDTVSTAVNKSNPTYNKIYLSDLDWFNASEENGGFYYYNVVKDNCGSTYANGIGGLYGGSKSFQEYILNGDYSKITGRVVLNEEVATQTSDDVCLWIYGDNNLLFQSQEVKAGCKPQDFTVDISNVSDLRVVIQGKSMLRLVDCILYR